MTVNVQVSTTPNEHALKFTLDRPVIESGHKTYANAEAAEESTVAKTLFGLEGVASVFLMADFITVTKSPEMHWDSLQPAALAAIQSSFE
jgi:hypothetical protein